MTDHDPLCQWDSYPVFDCRCDLIARVVERERSTMDAREASVRADEAKKWYGRAIEDQHAVATMFAHDEAVAAKLVEEVCRDEVLIQTLHGALIEAADQRDAARAEVERLRDQVESVRELLHRQRVLHGNLVAPTHPNAPVLIQVDQVLSLIEEAASRG